MIARAASFALVALAGAHLALASSPTAADLAHARRLLATTILFDGHNDLPWAIRTDKKAPGDVVAYDLRQTTSGQTDFARLKQGGLSAQFWSVYTPGESKSGFARIQLEQIDIMRQVIARYPDRLQLARTAKEIREAKRAGRIGSMLGIEGGHAIENSLGALRTYYDLGVRYMTLTHNVNTDWADAAADAPSHHGLTPFGEQVVLEMNRIGMLVDLSHTSAETMEDAVRVSKAPVIFSHSSARAVCDVPRNVPDDILKKMPANGGVVMVTFVPGFTDPDVAKVMQPALEAYNLRAREVKTEAERDKLFDEMVGNVKLPVTTVAKVADQIDYVRRVAGVEHVGIGGDFDGNSQWPEGLSDVSMYPNLFAELIHRGWTDKDLKLLAGENVLRALEQAEKVAAKLQATTNAPPFTQYESTSASATEKNELPPRAAASEADARGTAAPQGAALGAEPTASNKPAPDILGRPADLDLSKGVQPPKRDNSKLPSTFVAASKTQPINAKWATTPYRPKSRRDLTGLWINQGGIGWTPGIPPGPKQNPPLTPEYTKIFNYHLANAAAGKPTGDITASCLPPGMPRIMTMTYPMEITITPDHVAIYAEWQEQVRRIFTDGRPLSEEPEQTFNGESVGHWQGNFLVATSYGFRPDTNLESSGLPKSEKMIAYERLWLADDDTLRDEITLVDPVALSKPWTVTKTYKRAPPDFTLEPYVCLENNRNPIAEDGTIQFILKP